jgi:hypothetical protein
VEALRDLDIPQIRALERLKRLLDDHDEEEEAYHLAVQHAWRTEAHPICGALTRTGVAFEPSSRDTYGFAVDGITGFGQSLLSELHNVDAFDWKQLGSPPPE